MSFQIAKIYKETCEPPHDKSNKMACAPSEDSDQPGHPPSLIRVLAVRMKKAWVLSYPFSEQRSLWSDWADAQSFCWFCHEAAHVVIVLWSASLKMEFRKLDHPSFILLCKWYSVNPSRSLWRSRWVHKLFLLYFLSLQCYLALLTPKIERWLFQTLARFYRVNMTRVFRKRYRHSLPRFDLHQPRYEKSIIALVPYQNSSPKSTWSPQSRQVARTFCT